MKKVALAVQVHVINSGYDTDTGFEPEAANP
jgi:hypothetical protein